MKIRRAKVALVLYVALLAGLVLLADDGKGAWMFALADHLPWGDKIGHFILMGILSFLVNLLWRAAGTKLYGWTVLKGSAIILSIVTLEECSQLFFKSRTFDLFDLAADAVGIWAFGRLAVIYLQRRRAALAALHQGR